MKKIINGFTLVEMLTVIAILAVIFMISVPVYNVTVSNFNRNSCQSQVKIILNSAEEYAYEHERDLKLVNNNTSIVLNNLVLGNYLSSADIKNPVKGANFSLGEVIVIRKNANYTFTASFQDERICEK